MAVRYNSTVKSESMNIKHEGNNKVTLYFKCLNADRKPCNGGTGQWPEIGIWTPKVDPVVCSSGWHLFSCRSFFEWAGGSCLYLAEGRGIEDRQYGKIAFEQARLVREVPWDDRIKRLFAADCAERTLENRGITDECCWNAIKIARKFANGKTTQQELRIARESAARAVHEFAKDKVIQHELRTVRESAARAALVSLLDTTWIATLEVAWAAAWAAARAAARLGESGYEPAWEAERKWQIKHLLENYLGLRADW